MSFVIYNSKTFNRAFGYRAKSYETERAAKSVRTRAALDPKEWIVDTYDNYRAAEPMVTTYSIFDLKNERPILIRASEKGGCCDPGTETYHSM